MINPRAILSMLISSIGLMPATSAAEAQMPPHGILNDARDRALETTGQSLGDLPPDVGSVIRRAIREDHHAAVWQSGGVPVEGITGAYMAPNKARDLRSFFTPEGVYITPRTQRGTHRGWTLGLVLDHYGRDGTYECAEPAEPKVLGNRVEYQREGLIEWYVNDAHGLEQGFTFLQRPDGVGALEVVLDVQGDLRPVLGTGAVRLSDNSGRTVARYDDLKAWDASGRVLAAHLSLRNGRIVITVDDADATYPLTIDPLIINEDAKLLAIDGDSGDGFGVSTAISNDTLVVGAWRDEDNGLLSGSAYVFIRIGMIWTQQAKLLASDGGGGDHFGRSVAISGDTIVVGAFSDDNGLGSGSAIVFVRNETGWAEQAKLLASDGAATDLFGISVAISGQMIVVGAVHNDDQGFDSGSAYVFERNGTNWTEQVKLLASDGSAQDHFGNAVAISGETIVIGAPKDDDNGQEAGSAYVFINDGVGWTEQAKLLDSDGGGLDHFGASLAISGETIVVGVFHDDDNGIDSGSAFVFVRNGTSWMEQARLLSSDGAAGDTLGSSVAIDNDIAVVGAPSDDDHGAGSGSAYWFVRNGTVWTEQAKLLAVDGESGDNLGVSVAIAGDTIVVGAFSDDDNGLSSGSAYVFSFLDCNQNGILDVIDIANGFSMDDFPVGGDGIPDECQSDCNGNLVPDAEDILNGTSQDCNNNGTPDECDLAAGTSADCNGNGILDECDIGGSIVCGTGGNLPNATLTVEIFTDAFPGETTWELVEPAQGIIVSGGGPYGQFFSLFVQDVPICIESCYDFTIFDSFGDGICCGVGEGFYNLLIDGTLIATGGDFTFSETVSNIGECVAGASQDCQPNGIPDECERDCNANGIPDDCDGFVDTTPPVVSCSIVPAAEDDGSDDEGIGQQGGTELDLSVNPGVPDGSGSRVIITPAITRNGATAHDPGNDGPVMILFDAADDCGPVTVTAVLDIGCMQILVENGTVIAFECNEGDDSGDCEAEEEDGILEIEAASAVLVVTATDESGNTSTCELVLCTPPDDSGDDEGDDDATGSRPMPRPQSRGQKLDNGGSVSR